MKTRTLLYFGSFNPIHIGHTAIANYVIASGMADELWFVVSPQNPFKPAESLVSPNERLEMVQIAIEKSGLEERVSVCDVELHLPIPSYTIQTLEALWTAYPEREFSILMGSDNFTCIEKWKDAQQILDRCAVYVYGRPGTPTVEIPHNLHNIHIIPNAPLLEISSSLLRQLLTEGKYIPALLPPGVHEFIKEHGLYRINGKH